MCFQTSIYGSRKVPSMDDLASKFMSGKASISEGQYCLLAVTEWPQKDRKDRH